MYGNAIIITKRKKHFTNSKRESACDEQRMQLARRHCSAGCIPIVFSSLFTNLQNHRCFTLSLVVNEYVKIETEVGTLLIALRHNILLLGDMDKRNIRIIFAQS
jgi:hypothetical protein